MIFEIFFTIILIFFLVNLVLWVFDYDLIISIKPTKTNQVTPKLIRTPRGVCQKCLEVELYDSDQKGDICKECLAKSETLTIKKEKDETTFNNAQPKKVRKYWMVKWFYYDPATKMSIKLNDEDADSLEEEYLSELGGTRTGQRVFHCFGNKYSAIVNYKNMETDCGSGRCILTHKERGISGNHMTFKLSRQVEQF